MFIILYFHPSCLAREHTLCSSSFSFSNSPPPGPLRSCASYPPPNLFVFLLRRFTFPGMSSPDTTLPRGFLPPGLRARLNGYIGIRTRFQSAAWCKSSFFSHLHWPQGRFAFSSQSYSGDASFLFLAYSLIVYLKDIWARLRRGQLGVLFRNKDVRDHAFAEFYKAQRGSSAFPSSAPLSLHLYSASTWSPHSGNQTEATPLDAPPLPHLAQDQGPPQFTDA
ncbi:hypothetical protein F5883DRAFT_87434 [Diaporthe sp. PMI_573]|nr:hypothetical protein F5883DRAFT_87434 [Diaporthaceae sp. PMI_573]